MKYMYLAGPISSIRATGREEMMRYAEYASEVEGKYVEDGWCVINPYSSVVCDNNFAIDGETWVERGKAVLDLLPADGESGINLLPGWQTGRAVDERDHAEALGLVVMYEPLGD